MLESMYDENEVLNDFDNSVLFDDDAAEALADVVYDAGVSELDFLKVWKKSKKKKAQRQRQPVTAKQKIAKLRATSPESDMPLERRGELLLRSLFENGAVIGASDRASSRVYATGASTLVYLNKFKDYGTLRNVVIANTLGASVKNFTDGLKVAAANLVVNNTQSGWGYVIKVATPFNVARNQGVNVSITLGGVGTTLTVRLDPVSRPGSMVSMMEFVVLSVANNGGIGQPANATSCQATLNDAQAGVVDGQTSMSVESLNARDLGTTNAVSCG